MIKIFLCFLMLICLFLPVDGQKQEEAAMRDAREYIRLADLSIYTEPSKAVAYANAAILGAERAADSVLLVESLVSLGRSYVNLGSFDLGLEAYYKARDHCPAGSLSLQAYINVWIGNLYIRLEEIKRAFQFIDRAVTTYEQLKDTAGMSNCYNAQGLGYEKLGDDIKAEECFRKALALNRCRGDLKDIAKNLNNIGLLEPNPDEKIACLNEAVALNKQLGASWSLTENYNNLGAQYYYKKDYQRAKEWLQMALQMANKLSAKELMCDNYRYSTWVYRGMGNYAKAYESMSNLYNLEKSILSEKKIREIELNAVDRRFREQQRELNLKQKELQIRGLQRDIYLLTIAAVVVFTVLLLLFWRSRYRKKMQIAEAARRAENLQQEMTKLELSRTEEERKTMELELRHHKNELTNLACYLSSKNDLIEKIKSMIKESYQNAKPEVKTQLKTINAFITQYQNKDNTIGQMVNEIDRLNGEFIARLSALHPDLSKNEKQLASLLRNDFSTKEIALLIGSIPKTVNMARYRLRKKLGLETDEGLNEYMKGI